MDKPGETFVYDSALRHLVICDGASLRVNMTYDAYGANPQPAPSQYVYGSLHRPVKLNVPPLAIAYPEADEPTVVERKPIGENG